MLFDGYQDQTLEPGDLEGLHYLGGWRVQNHEQALSFLDDETVAFA